jgi:thymidylate synthase (FAD)
MTLNDMQELIKDPYFRVEVLSQLLDPQQIVYAAMRQDYSTEFIFDELDWISNYSTASFYNRSGISEQKAGELIVKHLLNSNRGHYGPLEHPQLVLNFGFFPHSVMQQIRTHRNVSFDVQSGRYTSDSIIKAATGELEIEKVFYLRPIGDYCDRQGKKYTYTEIWRQTHLEQCLDAAGQYALDIKNGMAEEHARGAIPFDIRQHWVMSGNARAIMHLLDIRGKFDVQPETRVMTEMMFEKFQSWMPEVAEWYEKARWRKGVLAP